MALTVSLWWVAEGSVGLSPSVEPVRTPRIANIIMSYIENIISYQWTVKTKMGS